MKAIKPLCMVLGLALAGPLAAADFKFGYIKIERIYSESAPAQMAQKKLEKEFAPREAELKKLAAKAKDLQTQLGKKPDEATRRSIEREMGTLEREYQAKLRDFRDDLNQRRNEEFAAVQERANRLVRQIAEKEQYDLVLQDAVYVNPKFDITPRVLKELEK
ncbi:OmpH family outer membrane protein [Craterilacuibacter sp.]|uniref:OmpH family outer membrane protein n=1 Tax=Craterilacuibacter sp. TaxID=2870909 RepID=UPI003F2F1ED7